MCRRSKEDTSWPADTNVSEHAKAVTTLRLRHRRECEASVVPFFERANSAQHFRSLCAHSGV